MGIKENEKEQVKRDPPPDGEVMISLFIVFLKQIYVLLQSDETYLLPFHSPSNSVVEHYVSNAKGNGFESREHSILIKIYTL